MSRRDANTAKGNAYFATCEPCGKRSFSTRSAARKTAKQIPGRGLHAYACPKGHGWHLGHLPTSVVRGAISKSDYVAGVERRRAAREATG